MICGSNHGKLMVDICCTVWLHGSGAVSEQSNTSDRPLWARRYHAIHAFRTSSFTLPSGLYNFFFDSMIKSSLGFQCALNNLYCEDQLF